MLFPKIGCSKRSLWVTDKPCQWHGPHCPHCPAEPLQHPNKAALGASVSVRGWLRAQRVPSRADTPPKGADSSPLMHYAAERGRKKRTRQILGRRVWCSQHRMSGWEWNDLNAGLHSRVREMWQEESRSPWMEFCSFQFERVWKWRDDVCKHHTHRGGMRQKDAQSWVKKWKQLYNQAVDADPTKARRKAIGSEHK